MSAKTASKSAHASSEGCFTSDAPPGVVIPVETWKEQLRLFAFTELPVQPKSVVTKIQRALSKRERLAALLDGELNFHGQDSGYASHDVHAFAAKFPPQIPRAFIRGLTKPGDIVLDPMMGSGTTVVEALLEGRKGIGLDIDPLALRLVEVKTTPLDVTKLPGLTLRVVKRASELLNNGKTVDRELNRRFDPASRAFINYWFLPTTQRELMALCLAISEVTDRRIRQFLELTFSSVIVTKSGGVSLARDLAHTRPHLDKAKVPKNALDQFALRTRKNTASMTRLSLNGTRAKVIKGDARAMPFPDEFADLIVTSPPYANAIDYMRAHKFSLVWFGKTIDDLSELRSTYIGSERVGAQADGNLPRRADDIIHELAKKDQKKAAVLEKYFVEMKAVLGEMYRVLRPDSAAVVVAGTSVMRGFDVQTHLCLADISEQVGFEVVNVARRVLDRNKRMMPARFGRKTDSMIEQRMHDEYVIGLLKP